MRLSSFCPAVLANLKLDYCFSDILKTVKNLDVHALLQARLGERSFSMEERVKTCMRANVNQQSFNHVVILHTQN